MSENGRAMQWRVGIEVTLAGMLVAATVWIVTAIHQVADDSKAAMSVVAATGQAADNSIRASMASGMASATQQRADMERRIVVLETDQTFTVQAIDRITTELIQLRNVESELVTGLQRLSDLLPEKQERKSR